jgi:hypothetical protein
MGIGIGYLARESYDFFSACNRGGASSSAETGTYIQNTLAALIFTAGVYMFIRQPAPALPAPLTLAPSTTARLAQ